jgi:hypothetical protein
MELEIRKICVFGEDVMFEMKALAQPFRHAAVAAVLKNPWHGRGLVADLAPEIRAIAPKLGKLLAQKGVALLGGPDCVESFGKLGAVGLGGDYEHASALIHTTLFGDECRRAVNGSAWMAGNQRICPPGAVLDVPLAHKVDAKSQNHYHSVPIMIPDAPRPDELVVAVAMASGPRPNARL